MLKSNIFTDFFKYTSLNVLGMLGLSFYILADTFFVALGLGTDGLAALNLAIPIYNFIHGCGLMIGIGGGTKYSVHKIRGESGDADKAFSHSVYLAAVFAAVFITAGLFLPKAIISLFGAEGSVFDMAVTYTRVILLFSPAFLMNNVLLCFVRNDGAPQLSMAAMLAGSFSNVILDWVFIFPCKMGIFGAVFATGLAPVISMAVLSLHFIKKKSRFCFTGTKPDSRLFGGILSGGIPSLVTELSSGVVIIIFNALIMGLEGNVGVAAYGVIANISLVVSAVYTGIAQGIQPIISRSSGIGNKKDISAVLRCALISAVLISAAVYTSVFFFAEGIANIFNSEQNALLTAIAAEGLRLYFLSAPFAGFNIIISMYFTSSENPRPAHVVSLLRGFIAIIPLALLMSYLWRIRGVWCSFPASEFVSALTALSLFMLHSKKANAVLRKKS